MARKKWQPNKKDYEIAENYKRLREDTINRKNKDKQYTQRDLAIAFKKDEHYSSRICDIENATVQPSIEDMKLYHNFFKVPYEFLLGETDSKKYENMLLSEDLRLSDKAISQLKDNRQSGTKYNLDLSAVVEVINFLLSNEDGKDLLKYIHSFLFFKPIGFDNKVDKLPKGTLAQNVTARDANGNPMWIFIKDVESFLIVDIQRQLGKIKEYVKNQEIKGA